MLALVGSGVLEKSYAAAPKYCAESCGWGGCPYSELLILRVTYAVQILALGTVVHAKGYNMESFCMPDPIHAVATKGVDLAV